MKGLTGPKKFIENLNLSEQKDSYHTIEELKAKLTFQQNVSWTYSGIKLMKNKLFVKKMPYCLVDIS